MSWRVIGALLNTALFSHIVTYCDAQLSDGEIAGIAVGVPMALLLLAIVIYLLCRRQVRKEGSLKEKGEINRGYENVTSSSTESVKKDEKEEHVTTISRRSSNKENEPPEQNEVQTQTPATEVKDKQTGTQAEPDTSFVHVQTEDEELTDGNDERETEEKDETDTGEKDEDGTEEKEEKGTEGKDEDGIEEKDEGGTEGKVGGDTEGKDEDGTKRKEEEGTEEIDGVDDIEEKVIAKFVAPLLERTKSRDDITFKSGWRRTVKLLDLLRAKLILEARVVELEREEVTESEVEMELAPYLIGQYPIAGIIINENGQKMALYHAFKQGIISRGTAVSLLEAQAAVGSIIDPEDGTKMSVQEAQEHGLLDRKMASVLARAERAVTGFKSRAYPETMSLFQAMKLGLVVETHGIRLLEAQIATGGIIDPHANCRLPVEVAYERGLFDERLHQILEDPSDDTKGFLDPNTQENLTYLDLIQRCVEDSETGLLLLPLVKEEERKDYSERHSSISSPSKSRTFSGRTFSNKSEGSLGGVEEIH